MHEKLVGLSAAADFVGMDALSELSAKKAIEGLQPSNAALTLQQAKQRGVQRVREASMAMVLKEFGAVCETEGFIRKLDVDLVCEVIEQDELRNAILKMNPFESEKNIKEMMDYADEDGDGHVDFEEFKKIMLYKKPKEAPPSFGSG